MRRIVLKESQAPYTLTLGDEVLSQEPVILERDGEAVAAVIPMAEYRAFQDWQAMKEREKEQSQEPEASEQEAQAFLGKVGAIRDALRAAGYRSRTRAEIDAQIETERESWAR